MIEVKDLTVAFGGVEAVKNISFQINEGEILGIVGESGSGKSVTALTMMGLQSPEEEIISGSVLYDGVELLKDRKVRKTPLGVGQTMSLGRESDTNLYKSYLGRKMGMVFQEPQTSMNPTKKVGWQVEEVLRLHTDMKSEERKALVLDSLRSVGLNDAERVYDSYPHQLSGGMRQRAMIAMAIILHPGFFVADEPTTALDVTVQTQIIKLLKEINEREKNAMLFITHDLNLARRLCNRIIVMKDGHIVETGTTQDIFSAPKEEYTQKLISAVPTRVKKQRMVLPTSSDGEESKKVLEVKHLDVFYKDSGNSLFRGDVKTQVLFDINFDIKKCEVMGLVGESGCGKTSLSKAILGMNRLYTGEIINRTVRPQMVFQDPYSSLNPVKTIGWLLEEPLRAENLLDPTRALSKEDIEIAAHEMLAKIGLPADYYYRRASQLSGGQRQRVSIGQALITSPELVICDEPVSALDVTMQAQIMELMQKLREDMKLSYLFISHDINVVYKMCDRIMVMKAGRIVEQGDTEEVFRNPKEEYTKILLEE